MENITTLRLRAEGGDAEAQNKLGGCYDSGHQVIKDITEAVKWFRLSAEQGNDEGLTNLAMCYAIGDGVEQDSEEAIRLFRLAAEKGNVRAKLNLRKQLLLNTEVKRKRCKERKHGNNVIPLHKENYKYLKFGNWYCKHNLETKVASDIFEQVNAVLLRNSADNTYYGIGKILTWIDESHLVSYNEETNQMYILMCQDTDKPLLHSVLSVMSFAQSEDFEEILKKHNIDKTAKLRKGLLINAAQWMLGKWGQVQNILELSEDSTIMLHRYEIDIFEVHQQHVIGAFYMNPESFEEKYLDDYVFGDTVVDGKPFLTSEHKRITMESPIYDPNDNLAMKHQIYRYADNELNGMFLYHPCTIVCPLMELQIVGNCVCKKGRPRGYKPTDLQIEMFCKVYPIRKTAGCVTAKGLEIFDCDYSELNNPADFK